LPTLERFQSQTSDALLDGDGRRPDALGAQESSVRARRFDIYRNNRAVSLVETLQATYPAVRKLVGDEFFSAVARAFIDAHPPTSPVLAEFGAPFGEFVSAIPGAQSIPYVHDVARIEWARNESYHSEDSDALSLEALAGLAPDAVTEVSLVARPCLRVIQSRWPAGSLWSVSSGGLAADTRIDMQQGECVVVVRPLWDVMVHTLSSQTAEFMLMLLDGATIGDAAASSLERDPEFDTGQNIGHLLGLGLFSSYLNPSP